jgi:8-oxo-dGTP pyrophosphatase MutT (NUDIX family)
MKEQFRIALAQHNRIFIPPGPVPAAVLIPLFLKDNSCHILFTKRSENLHHHRGEISFPGGVSHPEDADTRQTALRETWEEVGIAPEEVEVLGVLDDFLSIHNYLVTPFVGFVAPGSRFVPSPDEIERIIEVPLEFLLAPKVFEAREWTWQGRTFPLFFVNYGGDTIWGLTAAILKQFIDIISPGI